MQNAQPDACHLPSLVGAINNIATDDPGADIETQQAINRHRAEARQDAANLFVSHVEAVAIREVATEQDDCALLEAGDLLLEIGQGKILRIT